MKLKKEREEQSKTSWKKKMESFEIASYWITYQLLDYLWT